MKIGVILLVVFASLAKEANGNYAEAQIYFSGTNNFLGTIGFNEQEVAWGVIISGAVEHLRPNAVLVRQLLYFTSSIF
jgi:hypothetical protein